MFEIRAGVQCVRERITEFCGMVTDTSVEIGEVRIKVVIYFKLVGMFVKQHPAATAEYLYVAIAVFGQSGYYGIPQCFLTAYPRHKAVQDKISPPMEAVLRKKEAYCAPLRNTTIKMLVFIDLEQAHRENAYDAADKQTGEE